MLRTHPAFCKLKAIRLAEVNQVCPPRLPATPSPLMSPTHTRDETEIDDMMIVETATRWSAETPNLLLAVKTPPIASRLPEGEVTSKECCSTPCNIEFVSDAPGFEIYSKGVGPCHLAIIISDAAP